MRTLLCHFWRDESGSVVVGQWVFVATILVLGAVTGMVALHHPRFEDTDATGATHTAASAASIAAGR